MAQFNAFEEVLDFSLWREICEEHGTLRHLRHGEYCKYPYCVTSRIYGGEDF